MDRFKSRVPRYTADDSDYTTNAPSYYDDLARKNKLIQVLAERIGYYDEELAKRFEEWDKNIENLPEELKRMFLEWVDDGTLAKILAQLLLDDYATMEWVNRKLDIYDRKMEGLKENVMKQIHTLVKGLDLDNTVSSLLFELNLKYETVNQSIAINNITDEIYATQVNKVSGDDGRESHMISRLSPSGEFISSMRIRLGGHGTSIGVRTIGGYPYIITQINSGKTNGEKVHIIQTPYLDDEEITFSGSDFKTLLSFSNKTTSPIYDNENGILGVRITDSTSGSRKSEIWLYDIKEIEKGNLTPYDIVYFNNEMNRMSMQGLAIDGDNLYVSFGMNIREFTLFHIDENKNIKKYTNNILPNIKQLNNFSEPEGMFLYTDLKSKKKTLFHVIVTGKTKYRRNNLIGISSNGSLSKFNGYSNDRFSQESLLRQDGRAFNIDDIDGNITKLRDIKKTGFYYLNSGNINSMTDKPKYFSGGAWIVNTPKDTGETFVQYLIKNSSINNDVYSRQVYKDSETTWKGDPVLLPLKTGFKTYATQDNLLQGVRHGGVAYITGIIDGTSRGSNKKIADIPIGLRSILSQTYIISVKGGYAEVKISGSSLTLERVVTDSTLDYLHVNISYPTNPPIAKSDL